MSEKWYERVAKQFGAEVNPENEDLVVEGLSRNKVLHGARYCPCRFDRTPDTICPCKEFRETGHCHCGLFV